MPNISFNKAGGPISVSVSAGNAQSGSYDIVVLEAGSNQLAAHTVGQFDGNENPPLELPLPNIANRGRQVQSRMSIVLLPPSNKFSATMTVMQDGKEIGKVGGSGTTDEPSISVKLTANLTDGTTDEKVIDSDTEGGGDQA